MRKRRNMGRILWEAVMGLLSLLILLPLLYMVVASFKTKAEANRPLSFPSGLYIENFWEAFITGKFPLLLLNSIIVVALTLAVVIYIGSIASHPLSRRKGGFYKVLYFFFLSGIMIPFQAGMIPLYRLIKTVGLIDSVFSLMVINGGIRIPMAILIYTGFLKTVPRELEESATMDGCGRLGVFYRILFPLLKPATVSVVLINIIPIWNDFLTPLIFISSSLKKTLPVGMYNFMSERTVSMGPIFAFSVLTTFFPIVLFFFLQKNLYKGIVAGAVKG